MTNRIHFLDGIRGWAALSVLIGHLLFLLAPWLPDSDHYLTIGWYTLVRFISDGHLAVLIFFTLSGYALSIHQLNPSRRNLALAACSRYFRLLLPVLVTSLFAYLLLKLGLFFNQEVGPTSSWMGGFYNFDASLIKVLKFAFYDVFIDYKENLSYNVALWTMKNELLGSFFIYLFLGVFRSSERPQWIIIVPLAIHLLFSQPLLACFMVGYIIAELNTSFPPSKNSLFNKSFICLFIATAILTTIFRQSDKLTCVLAGLLTLSVSYSETLRGVFEGKMSRFLGEISFPLYLIQIPIICSWSSYLYLHLKNDGLTPELNNLFNGFTTISLSILLSVCLLPIEKLSIQASKKIGRLLLLPRQ